jgi:hypothetical protein
VAEEDELAVSVPLYTSLVMAPTACLA